MDFEDEVLDRRGRDRLRIMAEIMEVAIEGCLKTHIMYRANLSFHQLNDFVSLLLDLKMLESVKIKGKTTYKTTAKGLTYLESYRTIQELVKKTGTGEMLKIEVHNK